MSAPDGKLRVLSLDGGGVRGIITLEVLAYIEQQTGKRVSDLFDVIVGTSTGGLLALGLSKANPYTARAIAQIYATACPQIFHRSTAQKLKSFAQLAGPKYSNDALYACAMQILGGDTTMRDTAPATDAMVTTYDIDKRTPRFYTSWDTPTVLMLDAAMSTTAAPTYFAPWHNNVDGGVCDNNPALSGVIETCKRNNCTVRDVIVLSVGTGSDMVAYDGSKAAGWGLLTWADPLVSIFTDGTSELHAYHLRRLLPDENVLRVQCTVSGDLAGMDNADPRNLQALHEAGVGLVTANLNALNELLPRLGA